MRLPRGARDATEGREMNDRLDIEKPLIRRPISEVGEVILNFRSQVSRNLIPDIGVETVDDQDLVALTY